MSANKITLIVIVLMCFLTHEAASCESRAEHCKLPFKTGLCDAIIHRYGYDPKAQQCVVFVYGGCGGNENNFQTREECEQACMCQEIA